MTVFTKDVFGPLRTAIVAALHTDTALATAMGRAAVYHDLAPPKEPYPYMTVGDFNDVNWQTHTTGGHSTTLTVHGWDRGYSWARLDTMMGRVLAVLAAKKIPVAGFDSLHIWYEFGQSLTGPLPEQLHRTLQFRVQTLEA